MVNGIVILVLLLMVGAAAGYIAKAKKQGQKCIGCPYARECASKGCAGCAGASGNADESAGSNDT